MNPKYRATLLGLAAGDALGTTLEFKAPGTFIPITDMLGGGTFRLQPGQWTDDTAMALCLAESLIEVSGFDPRDQLARYLAWYRDGHWSSTGRCFDIGNATRAALEMFEETFAPYCGSEDARDAGNGSLMRLAPVPMLYANLPEQAIALSAHSSRTTHAARACCDACAYFGGLIVGALRGESKVTLLSPNYSPAPLPKLHPEIAQIAAGSFKERQPPQIKGSGYVVRSLEAALWAFYHTENFRDGALLAVNLGDDADTTGAIYGQLAGAYYGETAIPAEWRAKLTYRDEIVRMADELYRLAQTPHKLRNLA